MRVKKEQLLHFSIVAYKGLLGILEIVVGFLILTPLAVSPFFERIVASELSEDPQDILINWFSTHSGLFHFLYNLGFVLILLGGVKCIIAFGLWRRSSKIIRLSFWLLLLALLFGFYTLYNHFSILALITLMIDGSILFYLWNIVPPRSEQDMHRDTASG